MDSTVVSQQEGPWVDSWPGGLSVWNLKSVRVLFGYSSQFKKHGRLIVLLVGANVYAYVFLSNFDNNI